MGSSQSKNILREPSTYATPAAEEHTSGRLREYDYVIVGGGTAGCVLASRLSEDPSVTVLVLEYGKSHGSNMMTKVPLAYTKLFKTEVDWDYKTISINAMLYQHCSPEDFDEWVRHGATGWDYTALRPYFLKSECYTPSPDIPSVKREDHGSSGPLQTKRAEPWDMHKVVRTTVQSLNIPDNPDNCTARGNIGVADLAATIDRKGCTQPATAYLTEDVLSRPNLTVATEVMVEKLLIENDALGDRRATGVELSTSRTSPRYRVQATREVIVCAGTIATPQILQLSGLGPAAELARVGIPLIKDLPAVGQNLYDHISCGPISFRAKQGLTMDYLRHPLHGIMALLRWMLFGTGPMSRQATSGAAFVRSDDPTLPYGPDTGLIRDMTAGPGAPDIEIMWAPSLFINHGFTYISPDLTGLTMGAISLKPESAGCVTLATNSIYDKPLIDGRYLSSESDMNLLVRATRLCLRIARTEPLQSVLDLKPHSEDKSDFMWPGDADPDKITDDEIKEWIRRNGATAFHPTSTARMGRSIEDSVVDSELRVHGVRGLRVVDASVFPTQVSGHPCAVVIAVAERAADIIKGR